MSHVPWNWNANLVVIFTKGYLLVWNLFPVEMPSGGHLYRKSGGAGNQVGHLELFFCCVIRVSVSTLGWHAWFPVPPGFLYRWPPGGPPDFLYHLISCRCALWRPSEQEIRSCRKSVGPPWGHLYREPVGTGNQVGHLGVICTETMDDWQFWGRCVH